MEPRSSAGLAPGVPSDYYEAIARAEDLHWWHRGMRAISAALLGSRLASGGRVLDAGCGTGGFLAFLEESGKFQTLAGVDIASAALDLARRRLPSADLRVAALREIPFSDRSFDLVVANDVLQHVDETELEESLAELGRVLACRGTLLVRTNGSRRFRRERSDWRVYDRRTLEATLRGGGFDVARITYANMIPSLLAATRGRVPRAPSDTRHGIPSLQKRTSTVARPLLELEARWIRRGHGLPYGHTLFAVSAPRS